MRVPSGLLTVDDFRASLVDEAVTNRALMPRDPVVFNLWTIAGAADWALHQCVGNVIPIPEQIVTVRKSRHGVRPVAELCVRDRLLYRALVQRWDSALPSVDRSGDAFEEFQAAPLTDPEAAYVVSSDITAFYQYIDHGLLSRELVTRTGDTDGTDALSALLDGLAGRSFGVPQQSEPSDTLAETYLSVVHRRLVRQGLNVWRYNDDFRISVATWSEALDAVDRLEREARSLGLALNDGKTVIRGRDKYEASLSRHDTVLEEISADVEFDLTDWLVRGYEVVALEPDKADVRVEAARRVTQHWHEARVDEGSTSAEEREMDLVLSELLRTSLPLLADLTGDEEVLDWCGLMLRTEQALTPQVARHLQGVASAEPALLTAWFEGFLAARPYLTPWQALWIGPVIGEATGAYAAGTQQREWLVSLWQDPRCPEPVRAGLAHAMASASVLNADDLLLVYDAMTPTGRPSIARALGVLVPATHAGAASVMAEDDLSRWAFEMGASGD